MSTVKNDTKNAYFFNTEIIEFRNIYRPIFLGRVERTTT
jgi:hypothetical protein